VEGVLVTTRRSLTIQTVEKWPQPSFLMTTYLCRYYLMKREIRS
jgi:hypothetical protein